MSDEKIVCSEIEKGLEFPAFVAVDPQGNAKAMSEDALENLKRMHAQQGAAATNWAYGEVTNDDELKALIDSRSVESSQAATLKAKDARIVELEKQLASQNNAPKTLNATDVIAAINAATTIDDVNAAWNNDTRATVVKAKDARIVELAGGGK